MNTKAKVMKVEAEMALTVEAANDVDRSLKRSRLVSPLLLKLKSE